MEVFAPMPSAIEMMASAAKPGLRRSWRSAEADDLKKSFHAWCKARGLRGGLDNVSTPLRTRADEMRARGGLDSGNWPNESGKSEKIMIGS